MTTTTDTTTEYAAYTINTELAPLAVHSETAGPSLSMADAVTLQPASKSQNDNCCCNVLCSSFVGLFVLASVGSAAAAMYLEATLLMYISFSCPIILAPIVMYQRSCIQRLPTFRDVHNFAREQVNQFAIENFRLHSEVNKLQRQKTRLSAVEDRFEELCERESKDVSKMKVLVEENKAIQEEIKTLRAADELQALLATIMKADKDGNSFISEKELDEVMLRMKVFGGKSGGSKFDEATIRAAFKASMTSQGASLIRVHSALQKQRKNDNNESYSGNDFAQSNKPSPPVETLQKVPRNIEQTTNQPVSQRTPDTPINCEANISSEGTESKPIVIESLNIAESDEYKKSECC